MGKIYKYKNILQFRVESIKELKVIVNHFDNYPLITNKRADYELFRKTYDIVISKEHLNENGLKKIVALKASLNKGLSDKLKIVFSDIVPVDRPLVQDQSISDPSPPPGGGAWITSRRGRSFLISRVYYS